MRIGIDGGCWTNRRGYGRFLRELLGAIRTLRPSHTFTVFLDSAGYDEFHLGEPFRPVLVETTHDVGEAATAEGRRSLPDLLRMSLAAARERFDLFFFPSVFSYFPLPRRGPVLLGIHDTMADRNPHLAFASRAQQRFWRWKVRLALLQAQRILTVSHHSAACIEATWGVPRERIRVVYEAASPVFQKLDITPPAHPFVLYVGGISPNKNLPTLLRAFSRLRRPDLRLVLVGDYQSDTFKSSYAELQTLPQDRVTFTGYLSDDELCRLYNQAVVFAMPSLDEGFGLPALEAMACGAPVVVSTGNALQEVVGDAGLLAPAMDEAALAAALERAIRERAALSAKSLARAAQFSWAETARQMLQVFEE